MQAKTKNGVVAQVVEQWTENPCVAGSTPANTTKQRPAEVRWSLFCGVCRYGGTPPNPPGLPVVASLLPPGRRLMAPFSVPFHCFFGRSFFRVCKISLNCLRQPFFLLHVCKFGFFCIPEPDSITSAHGNGPFGARDVENRLPRTETALLVLGRWLRAQC